MCKTEREERESMAHGEGMTKRKKEQQKESESKKRNMTALLEIVESAQREDKHGVLSRGEAPQSSGMERKTELNR